jgi:hypothetical protein
MDEQTLDGNETVLTNDSATPGGSEEGVPETPVLQKGKTPFVPDRRDSYFALFAFVLGFFFAHWVLFSWQGWGVTLFTLVFCGSVTLYLLKKGVHISKPGWFWLAVVVLLGVSFGLWSNNGLAPWHGLLLFGSALYWILSTTGLLIMGQTSNFIILDGYNASYYFRIKSQRIFTTDSITASISRQIRSNHPVFCRQQLHNFLPGHHSRIHTSTVQ